METLNEAINYDKYSDKVERDLFDWLVGLDPSQGKKYAAWIVMWFFKELEVDETLDALTERGFLKADNLWPLSLETLRYVSRIASSYDVSRFIREDHSKVTEDLKAYDRLKTKNRLHQERQKNIMNVPGFMALYEIVMAHEDDLDKLDIEESDEKPEADKWFEDDAFLVVVPENEIASRKYGAHTRWCTAAKEDNQFDYYNRQGPLIIFIDKKSGEKWQVHIESNQWMDARDSDVDKTEFLNGLPVGVKSAVYKKTHDLRFNPNPVTLLTELCKEKDFVAGVSCVISGRDLLTALDYGDVSIPDRLVTYGLNDYAVDAGYDYSESYGAGYDRPDLYLEGEPAGEDGEWTEDQRSEAGMKAEDAAFSDEINEVSRYVLNNPSYSKREYGSTAYENMLDFIVSAVFSEGDAAEKARMLTDLVFSSDDVMETLQVHLKGYLDADGNAIEHVEEEEEGQDPVRERALAESIELDLTGFTPNQKIYMERAKELYDLGYDLEEIKMELGYGVIDDQVLEDTFSED